MIRLFSLVFALLAAPALAQSDMPDAPYANVQLEDPSQEAEALELMATLRCLTCQSQSIHDSDAPIAGDMRHQVRSRILAGEEPENIRAWMIERYGDYISYEPTVNASTWPLFVVPVLLLLAAMGLFWRRMRRA
ncbi:cytochrome c-type biogenesis protein [Parerythrobacter aestuarii]|uniref:cytochrome c-type biogenesis protein n=1 Tax=Parerythrobacter aestuarii TaxID=3020909 RepID=UPI0024DE748A|nr:cytochrome c-type biogenesis protein [Parerythrobacter aestuarii]